MSPAKAPDDRPSHTIVDHDLGALASHAHGEGEFDHDHDEDFLEADSKSLESVALVSMGVDIGSSGTQVVFSRLDMRGPGEHRALRRRAMGRQTLYMSPISITPLRDDNTIDGERLRRIVDQAFAAAKLTPDEIETGVIILTGEAAARANAEAIAHLLAQDVGELVCAAAGHHMEATLAAHGSGAVEMSRAGEGQRILLIDIGGATTKFALVDDGRVVATAALAVGGRLLVIDRANRITRLDPMGAEHARRAGMAWTRGDVIDPRQLGPIADMMADCIVAAIVTRPAPKEVAALFVTEPLGDLGHIDAIMVSGGVGEYVHGRETRDFGDLGRWLGRALRRRFDAGAFGLPLSPPGECIRATALGASEYSVQLSGQTIYISAHAALLPRRNLRVLRPPVRLTGEIDARVVGEAIRAHRGALDAMDARDDLALAFAWRGAPSYQRARALAEGVAMGMADHITRRAPLYLLMEGDAAMTLGAILREDMKIASEMLVIDGIVLGDFDYVDIGRVRMPSHTIPVTIKSLVFGAGPGRID